MRRALGLFILAAVVVAVAWVVAGLPGQVSIAVAGLVIQTATSLAVLAALILLLLLYILVRLLFALVTLPRRLAVRRERRKRGSGDETVSRALTALAAGEQRQASDTARRARRLLGDTPQTLLLAAEAARMAGRDDEAAATYRLMAGRPDAKFLGLRGLFRAAMAREDWPEANRLAQEAEAAHPGGTWLREARLGLAARTGDWKAVLPLAGPDAPLAALGTAAAEIETDPERARALAERAWSSDRGFAPAALLHARLQREAGREGRTQDALRSAWKLSPHPDLASLALAPVTDPLLRVRQATGFVSVNPAHAESHLLLARLALQAGLTGEARRHAEAAGRAGLYQRRYYLLLAELEEASHNQDAARLALRDAATADPDPVWRCEACNAQHETWHAACPNCHTPGRLVWTVPRVSRMAIAAPAIEGPPRRQAAG